MEKNSNSNSNNNNKKNKSVSVTKSIEVMTGPRKSTLTKIKHAYLLKSSSNI